MRLERAIVVSTLKWVTKVISAMDDDLRKSIDIKHANLKATAIPDDLLTKICDDDKMFLSQWKETIFTTVAISTPERYLKHIPHYVWETVSLEKIAKELEEEDTQ